MRVATWCFSDVRVRVFTLRRGFLFTPYAVFPTQQSAERCVSTLLDLIQTKVNYVVQEAIVVIRDIFRKYPNKYVRLCEYKGKPVLCIARGNDLNVFTKR